MTEKNEEKEEEEEEEEEEEGEEEKEEEFRVSGGHGHDPTTTPPTELSPTPAHPHALSRTYCIPGLVFALFFFVETRE